ncbi:YfcE family phosphodiesterase [bacterium]|jgi:putative phosphoesterase|nr:YfcE family phosphodiesterase [bacterium]MBT6832405.1 YfcE family phosphodiesterase [bacterium]MBT6996076.1 YfcE family phosphodiesterase [bacterium]MBT7772525.1 YfcE family phosphodiesterase [bacterium]
MKIAIVSDTHGAIDRFEIFLEKCRAAKILEIVHAGDFAVDGFCEILEKFPDLNFKIARGNADLDEETVARVRNLKNVELAEVVHFSAGGKNFAVSHFENVAEQWARDHGEKIDIFIHGHTHRKQAETRNESAIINPGSLFEDPQIFILNVPEMKLELKFFDKI